MASLTDMLGGLFDSDERYSVPGFLGNLGSGIGDVASGIGQLGTQAIETPSSIPGMLGQLPGAYLSDIKRRYTEGDLAENIYNEPASFLFDALDVAGLGGGAAKGLKSGSKWAMGGPLKPGGTPFSGGPAIADDTAGLSSALSDLAAAPPPAAPANDFLYHGTGQGNLGTIGERGLDAGHWSPQQRYAENFAGPEGALLRSRRGRLGELQPGETPGSYQAGNVGPENLEMMQQGEWGPLPQPEAFTEADLGQLQSQMGQGGIGGRMREVMASEEGAITPGAVPGKTEGLDPNRFYETSNANAHAPMPSDIRAQRGRRQTSAFAGELKDTPVTELERYDADIEAMENYLAEEFIDQMPEKTDVYGGAMSKGAPPVRELRAFIESHPFADTLRELKAGRREMAAELGGDADLAGRYGQSYADEPEGAPPAAPPKKQTQKRSPLEREQRQAYWRDEAAEFEKGTPERTEAQLQGRAESGNLAPSRDVGSGGHIPGDVERQGSALIAQADREWLKANPSLRDDTVYETLRKRVQRALVDDTEVARSLSGAGFTPDRLADIMRKGEYVKAFDDLKAYVASRPEAPRTISNRQSVDLNATAEPSTRTQGIATEKVGFDVGNLTERDFLTPVGDRRYAEDALTARSKEGDLSDTEQAIVRGGRKAKRTRELGEMTRPSAEVKTSPFDEAADTDVFAGLAPDAVEALRKSGMSDERIVEVLGGVKPAPKAAKASRRRSGAKKSTKSRTEKAASTSEPVSEARFKEVYNSIPFGQRTKRAVSDKLGRKLTGREWNTLRTAIK